MFFGSRGVPGAPRPSSKADAVCLAIRRRFAGCAFARGVFAARAVKRESARVAYCVTNLATERDRQSKTQRIAAPACIDLRASARNGLARGESFVSAVPERDRRFVQLPAQVNEFAAAERWKINESEVEILDGAAVPLDGLDRLQQLLLQLARATAAQRHRLGPRFRLDPLRHVGFEQRNGKIAPVPQHLLDERSQGRQQRVGLFQAESFQAVVFFCPTGQTPSLRQ